MPILAFLLARRFGALADRIGPHLFMGLGPIVAGCGLLLLLRVGAHPSYTLDVLPGIALFGLGLAMTVAPLTAAVLGSVEGAHSGAASGVNNAVARVASLVAIAAVGAVVAGRFGDVVDQRLATARTPTEAIARAKDRPLVVDLSGFRRAQRATAREALVSASVDGYRLGIGISAGLAFAAGLISVAGVRNARRTVRADSCPGGALYGASTDLASNAAVDRAAA